MMPNTEILAVVSGWQVVQAIRDLINNNEGFRAESWSAHDAETLIGPSGIFTLIVWAVIRYVRWFTRRMATRNTGLEEIDDPARSTSGLREDGTDPNPGETP